eukprot:TRINITY_DN56068_c0_g1_i1.p1 TRINITY_DN56068_c0_g1~~TRINITY_DN56068_c0_g1_i1.p1  ORF type:complete len:557 (-),score=103.58 TRINITY_DN56068_c0_g1_i1:175-1845(-)
MAGIDDFEDAGGGAEDGNSLISFENLEHVIRHIVRKFKTLEFQNEKFTRDVETMQRGMAKKASVDSVNEAVAEYKAKFDEVQTMLTDHRVTATAMQTRIDNNDITTSRLRQDIEACAMQKDVQDRLISDLRDAMLDKVSTTQLHLYEARFAGYATRGELHELNDKFAKYTPQNVTERLENSFRQLGTRFDEFVRLEYFDVQLKALREWCQDELDKRAMEARTAQRFQELNQSSRQQNVTFREAFDNLDAKLRSMSDTLTSSFHTLQADLDLKAPQSTIDELTKRLDELAKRNKQYEKLEDAAPRVAICELELAKLRKQSEEQKVAIGHLDTLLLEKAAKFDMNFVNKRIDNCAQQERVTADMDCLFGKMQALKDELMGYMSKESARFNTLKPPDYRQVFQEIQDTLNTKADRTDLIEMNSLKANRMDADEMSKLQETIHKQIEYLSVTTYGLAKLALTDDSDIGFSKTMRVHQKEQVLLQAKSLWDWVLHNDSPPNVDTLSSPKPGKHKSTLAPDAPLDRKSNELSPRKSMGARSARDLDNQRRRHLEKKLLPDVW